MQIWFDQNELCFGNSQVMVKLKIGITRVCASPNESRPNNGQEYARIVKLSLCQVKTLLDGVGYSYVVEGMDTNAVTWLQRSRS